MLKTQTNKSHTHTNTKKKGLFHILLVHLYVRSLIYLNTLISTLLFEPPIIYVTTVVIKHHRTPKTPVAYVG